jgi:8-oxo-dGTP diphosphatase
VKRSVAGIAVAPDGIFIALRKAGGDLGGKWEFPGGKVEEGEGDASALRREYREEFGVAIEVGPLLASAEFTHHEHTFALNAYRIAFNSFDFRMSEHIEWRWADLDEIESLDFADSDRLLLPALQAHFNPHGRINDR